MESLILLGLSVIILILALQLEITASTSDQLPLSLGIVQIGVRSALVFALLIAIFNIVSTASG